MSETSPSSGSGESSLPAEIPPFERITELVGEKVDRFRAGIESATILEGKPQLDDGAVRLKVSQNPWGTTIYLEDDRQNKGEEGVAIRDSVYAGNGADYYVEHKAYPGSKPGEPVVPVGYRVEGNSSGIDDVTNPGSTSSPQESWNRIKDVLGRIEEGVELRATMASQKIPDTMPDNPAQ
jgi:hypothetical protein